MNRRLYAIHRLLAAMAAAQLLIWTLTGSFFAIVPITSVRGDRVRAAEERALSPDGQFLPPAEVLSRLSDKGLAAVSSLTLRATPSGIFYLAVGSGRNLRVDARTGSPAPVLQAEAEMIARRDQPGQPAVRRTRLISHATGIEYRGKPLPAWRIEMADGRDTAVYVDASTGEVTARRSDLWRFYDFLWSLHIMDYREREDFNHPLIILAAVLAVFTALSGGVLWGVRLARRVRRRRLHPSDAESASAGPAPPGTGSSGSALQGGPV